MKFYELGIGAWFVCQGRRFEKIGMGAAMGDALPEGSQSRWGYLFLGEMEVEPEGEPVLLPQEVAAQWGPGKKCWTDYLAPAPAGTAGDRR